jgi:hypothetical protein
MWGSENPCDGCGQANKHAYKDKPALPREKCPLRSHPDWNGEDVPWEQSKAAKLMRANKIPRVDRNGRVLEDTVMDRLHHSYRARMDKDGPVKLETPITRDSAAEEGVTLWSEGSGPSVYGRPVYCPPTNGPTANGPTANGPTENGPPVRPSDRPTVRPSDRNRSARLTLWPNPDYYIYLCATRVTFGSQCGSQRN